MVKRENYYYYYVYYSLLCILFYLFLFFMQGDKVISVILPNNLKSANCKSSTDVNAALHTAKDCDTRTLSSSLNAKVTLASTVKSEMRGGVVANGSSNPMTTRAQVCLTVVQL